MMTARGWSLLAGLILSLTLPMRGTQAEPAPPTSKRPPFAYPDQSGKMRHVKEWDGKVLVINFWATWCAPCRREMPLLVETQRRYAKQGVQVIGVALDDAPTIAAYLRSTDLKINYPLLAGDEAAMDIALQYGNIRATVPYTVVVDRAGRPLYSYDVELTRAVLDRMIKPAL